MPCLDFSVAVQYLNNQILSKVAVDIRSTTIESGSFALQFWLGVGVGRDLIGNVVFDGE